MKRNTRPATPRSANRARMPLRPRAWLFVVAIAGIMSGATAHADERPGGSGEVLTSAERGHVFIISKGQNSRRIEAFRPAAGQKIRLVGFTALSLDQLRAGATTAGPDIVIDLGGGQELTVVGADKDALGSVQIELDRSGLVSSFADEFDQLSLDLEDGAPTPGRWRTNFGYGGPTSVHSRTLVNNGELEVYVDPKFAGTGSTSLNLNPFRTGSGKLDIVAEPLDEKVRSVAWGRSYASGLLTTKASFSQQYGVFEIRAKVPRGKGLWPAFWLLPANGAWPPELDVLEILGDNPSKVYMSWHSNAGGKHSFETKPIDIPDASADFHTYSVEWTKDTINWFFDDIEVASAPTPQDLHQPMYMLINLAVGGGWPGAPNAWTKFPALYSIDWVRAYTRPLPTERSGASE
ncbi:MULTISPECIES: glycoside hydrolase family 16 protein [unclassified Bradyrhizobium]|uniref:glycoside hydrolase family 16 protein n=2 Tax=unclassified Bradyrhizobium TaxID=2631580 RepID=UPI0029167914|nr:MULTISPECIES: glycoside hydrolase family 16 protein [unclassified Bradyrhizobium]